MSVYNIEDGKKRRITSLSKDEKLRKRSSLSAAFT
jgi:hypothetical protein